MIILHFRLQPQCKYEIFSYILHIVSLHTGRYELNKLMSLPMCSFIAQLVEHCNGIHGGHGFESHWRPDFFRLLSNCLNWKILLQWSFFTFICNRSTNMKYFHICRTKGGIKTFTCKPQPQLEFLFSFDSSRFRASRS